MSKSHHGENNETHPLQVKLNWNPPVQPSVALENYPEEVRLQLAKIEIAKPKNNSQRLTADNCSTTVIMNKQDKIEEFPTELDDQEN